LPPAGQRGPLARELAGNVLNRTLVAGLQGRQQVAAGLGLVFGLRQIPSRGILVRRREVGQAEFLGLLVPGRAEELIQAGGAGFLADVGARGDRRIDARVIAIALKLAAAVQHVIAGGLSTGDPTEQRATLRRDRLIGDRRALDAEHFGLHRLRQRRDARQVHPHRGGGEDAVGRLRIAAADRLPDFHADDRIGRLDGAVGDIGLELAHHLAAGVDLLLGVASEIRQPRHAVRIQPVAVGLGQVRVLQDVLG
jgi:hypothetical protein